MVCSQGCSFSKLGLLVRVPRVSAPTLLDLLTAVSFRWSRPLGAGGTPERLLGSILEINC